MRSEPRGVAAASMAYLMWGTLAIYWKQLEHVSACDILAYRVFFSFLILLPVMALTKRVAEVKAVFAEPAVLLKLLCSTALVAANWGIYIWAVNSGRILETSLGYYMNPLVNMVLGCVLFREQMSGLQKIAFALVTFGIMYSVFEYGAFPWVGIGLCLSFGFYGAIRKAVAVESLPGLFVETMLLTPVALIWIIWTTSADTGFLPVPEWKTAALLWGAGIVTTIPMALFAYATRHVTLVTLGFIQFISPTGSFLIGAFMYDEPITSARAVMFAAIWSAVALQMFECWREYRRHLVRS